MKRPLLTVIAALAAHSALAAGFALPEQSARAVATAGANTASAAGASAVYYDIANLAFEDGISAEISGMLIAPSFQYEPLNGANGSPTSAKPQLFAQPAVFAAAPVAPGLFVGLGAFSNFGLGITWPSDFPGRFESSAANITTFTVNPAAAYRFNEQWGIGAGVDVVRATVELAQGLDFIDQEGALRLGAGTWGLGFNVGAAGKWLGDDLRLGLSYRSSVLLSFRGLAHFDVPAEFASTLTDQEVTTRIALPHVVALGASYRATSQLRVMLDATYFTWSALRALTISFPSDGSLSQDLRRDWHNTLSVRGGAELQLNRAIALRLGTGFDPSPSPANTLSPSLPDSNRVLASAGGGYRAGNFTADLGYMLVLILPRESVEPAFPARYQGNAHVLALTVGFRQ